MIMKKVFLLFAAVASVICSCTKTPDADLGDEFQGMEGFIDMSKSNQFDETLFCNTWEQDRVIQEVYVDGELESSAEANNWSKVKYTFRKDHTMSSHVEGSSSISAGKGTWLYSHNYLMMHVGAGYYSYEVVYAKKGVLHLRREATMVGGPFKYYYEDPSGKHVFYTMEFTAR